MSSVLSPIKTLTRDQMAARLAQDIPEGWYVNLGIGAPTIVSDYVPAGREVFFHAENGLLAVGPKPGDNDFEPWLINAGKFNVTLLPGASVTNSAESFGIIRGGFLDLAVLGGYEVAENGDLANWSTGDKEQAPAVGGAMDLGAGAKQVWVMMDHVTKSGTPRLVERCSYPLTALGSVTRVYTNMAVVEITPRGFEFIESAPGLTFEDVQARTGAKLHRK